MTQAALTDEQCQEATDAFRQHGTQAGAALALGLARTTFQCRLYTAAQRGFLGFDPVLPGFTVSETVTRQNAEGDIVGRTIRQRKEHGETFKLPEGHRIKGVSALIDPDGRTIAQWVKTKESAEQQAIAERFALNTSIERGTQSIRISEPPRLAGPIYESDIMSIPVVITYDVLP